MSAEKAEAIVPVSTREVADAGDARRTPTATGSAEDGAFDTVSTMADLKERAPEVYRVMMQGIGMNICSEMRKHQRRFKEIMKKARDNAR